ncbi:C-GCAxxG-C-C family protein [Maridesulfovibrio sp. FT414]|uniref:C-GCAxxG-C-C family protein n=1 Tax=Maridesulfovibrio sp. FT414 TaxID=2979469 RepID=UPI003D809C69
MNTCIKCKSAAEKAGEYFGGGYHCAEAVAKAAMEHLGRDPQELVACATAFGGGYGKTFQEACGALSGALLVIGHLYGRREADQNWDYPAALAGMIRDEFVEAYSTTRCIDLREKFGPEDQMDECRKIVRLISKELLELIESDAEITAGK